MVLEDESSKLAEKICCAVFEKIDKKELMQLVKEKKEVYLLLHRETKEFYNVYVGENNKDFGEFLAIPVPKRFVLLEPDEEYFEVALKANIAIGIKGERDFHC